jgi:hypothetical protein
MRELAAGKLTKQAWQERTQALGIDALSLAPSRTLATAKAIAT